MINHLLRGLPLKAYQPMRQAVHDHPRGHPIRLAATAVLRRAVVAHRNHLAERLTEIRPLDAPTLSFVPVDSMVMDAVYWFGIRGYEGVVSRVWASLCARSHSVLEIGGNVGLFTVIGASQAPGAYTVVEPVPGNAETLRANLARNGLGRVELLQAAVIPGKIPRNVTLSLPDEGRTMPVGAHLVESVEIEDRAGQVKIEVSGLPMQQLAAGRDVIKIDAEGIEAALLADIRSLLVAHRPTLMVEVLPEATHLGELLASLATEAGYLIYVLPEWGSDKLVKTPASSFTSSVPKQHNSKDVVLVVDAIQ